MTTIVTGLYDNPDAAEKARQALMKSGCQEQDIDLFGGDTDIKASLSREGFEQDEIQDYSQAVQQGCVVMLAHVDDDAADQAVEIMRRHGTRQLEEIVSQSRQQRGEGQQQRGQQRGQQQTESFKEVEETVEIGKRPVVSGGVRIQTHVTERPVEETVSLREEKVNVERREAQRDLSPEEAEEAFKETSAEMHETSEEAEVRKAARQIGEVNLSKSTETREETVRDTARRTEVDVEKIQAGSQSRDQSKTDQSKGKKSQK